MAGMAATGRADRRPILVVDDDVKIVRLVRTYLERAGYRVVEATDGRSALAAITLEMPVLVVLDVMLPEVDGLSVLRAVRRTDRTPVIILSARGLVDDRIAGLDRWCRRLPREALLASGARAARRADPGTLRTSPLRRTSRRQGPDPPR